MPTVKGSLLRHTKVYADDDSIVEIKMWQVPVSSDKPHGYKYSLVYIVKGQRAIGYDNAEGKGDHRHYGKRVEHYLFRGLRQLTRDFYRDVQNYKKGKRNEGQEG